MHHATPLITTIVGGLVLAFILGMLANKLRISPLVGYLLAGVLAGPFTAGFGALCRAGLVVNDRYRVRFMSFHRQYRGVTART